MAKVLTTSATVVCSHADSGTVKVGDGQAALKVDGKGVLVKDDVVGKTISGCNVTTTNTTSPCVTAGAMTDGEATKLKVSGKAVLLATATGATDSKPPGTWKVQKAGQTKLDAT
jgi:hypothetical protein